MKKNLPTIIIIGLIVLVVVFVIYAMTRPEDTTKATNTERPKVEADAAKLLDGHSLGPTDAKVTLSEFGDYQCPACGKYHPVLKDQILPKYEGKIRFVFLNYPLPIHKNAQAAAQAAESVGLQGNDKFWRMHDILYERQTEWEKEKDPKSKFEGYAKEAGADLEQYKKDFDSQKVIDIINQQAALGDAFKIPGTPTFFVNGVMIDSQNGVEAITQAIDRALAQ
jgi:protein-disulfide isomerase